MHQDRGRRSWARRWGRHDTDKNNPLLSAPVLSLEGQRRRPYAKLVGTSRRDRASSVASKSLHNAPMYGSGSTASVAGVYSPC